MNERGGLLWVLKVFLILMFSLGFFCLQIEFKHEYAHANEPTIVINEIAWMGTINSANDEWIELYNKSDGAIDLAGWTLNAVDGQPKINLTGSIAPGGYFLLERTSDDSVPNVTADQIYTGALGNSGEILELRDNGNNIIDNIDAGSGWPAGDNTTKATMERKNDNSWQTSVVAGGSPEAINTSGQIAIPDEEVAPCGNGILETGEGCDDGNTASGDGCSSLCRVENSQPDNNATSTEPLPTGQAGSPSPGEGKKYKLGVVVINEFVSDPADNEVEWIELYNTASQEIDLSGWTVEEGSKAISKLSGVMGVNGNDRYKIIEKPSGNLNNSGDIIILREPVGKLIDQVSYGNWDDGNKENNAPVAPDPNSVARIFDEQNTFNNAFDFSLTNAPTKGKSNIIQKEDEINPENKGNFDYSKEIFISEIFPNPTGADNEKEFIEIYNKGKGAVNLNGWSLSDNENKKKQIEEIATSTIISAGGYLAIFRPRSKIVLNNDKDEVKLYEPLAEKPLQIVQYKEVIEGWSYNLDEKCLASSTGCAWQWSETVTPGEANIIKTVNHEPTIDFIFPDQIISGKPIIFDSSDTFDQDGDELKYSWDFGDGLKNNLANPEHTFFKPGNYTVKLTVTDGTNEAKKEKIIKVLSITDIINLTEDQLSNSSEVLGMSNDENVIINEILPNPTGDDLSGEWLELINQAPVKINLFNWKIESNSASYKLPNILSLESGSLYLLKRAESKLTLNNQGGSIKLFDDLGQLVDQVEYGTAAEGESYGRGENGKWFWTTILTPGEENIISVANTKGTVVSKASAVSLKLSAVEETTLEQIKDFEIGDLVKVKGIVAVLPGTLGSQFFYIVGSPGLQIYNYYKYFPTLKVGDYVEVSGELSESAGERRLKTNKVEDIKVLEHRLEPIAESSTCDKVSEEITGNLIMVSGEVTARKSSTVYLDDGTDEIMVYIKSASGIDPKIFEEGQFYNVTGILGKTNTGLRLLPRSLSDIVRKNQSDITNPQVLGEVAAGAEWEITERNKKLELFKYLLIIASALIIILIGLIIKIGRKQKEN